MVSPELELGMVSPELLGLRGFAVAASCLLVASLPACSPGKRPFLVAEVCLRTENDLSMLTREMRSIAASENMVFVDHSLATRRNLETIEANAQTGLDVGRTINIDISRADGMGIGIGNLGLPGYQVALGFSEGADEAGARRFARGVVDRLRRQWRVEIVPPDRGAQPMKDC